MFIRVSVVNGRQSLLEADFWMLLCTAQLLQFPFSVFLTLVSFPAFKSKRDFREG